MQAACEKSDGMVETRVVDSRWRYRDHWRRTGETEVPALSCFNFPRFPHQRCPPITMYGNIIKHIPGTIRILSEYMLNGIQPKVQGNAHSSSDAHKSVGMRVSSRG